jgi:hypothetical protein
VTLTRKDIHSARQKVKASDSPAAAIVQEFHTRQPWICYALGRTALSAWVLQFQGVLHLTQVPVMLL